MLLDDRDRVVLRVHWTTDVLAGSLLGLGVAALSGTLVIGLFGSAEPPSRDPAALSRPRRDRPGPMLAGALLACLTLAGCQPGPDRNQSGPSAPAPPPGTAQPRPVQSPIGPGLDGRLVLFGDGLLDGPALAADHQSPGYLISAARPDLDVFEYGLGHEDAGQLSERLRQVATMKPGTIVVSIGTYDAERNADPAKFESTLTALRAALGARHVAFLEPVQTFAPGNHDARPFMAAVRRVAAATRDSMLTAGPLTRADFDAGGSDLTAAAEARVAAAVLSVAPPAQQLPVRKPPRWVLVGDSLISGAELPDSQALPYLLSTAHPEIDWIDMGAGGQRTVDLLQRSRQFQLVNPQAAIVWAGTQDASDGTAASEYQQRLTQLLDALRPMRITLVAPVPDYSNNPLRPVQPYVQATRAVATGRGIRLVDLNPLSTSDFLPSGVHLNAATEARLARVLLASI